MKIVTAVVNNPDFIEIQYHTLKKYVKCKFEFIVFNDAKEFPDFTNAYDITVKTKLQDVCDKLGIKCINIPNNHHQTINAMYRCADAMNFILEYQKQNPDKYLVIDSDMFLISDLDFDKYCSNHCAILLQERNNNIFYIWNGIYYFDMTKLKNIHLLRWDPANFCDVGGMMQQWFSM